MIHIRTSVLAAFLVAGLSNSYHAFGASIETESAVQEEGAPAAPSSTELELSTIGGKRIEQVVSGLNYPSGVAVQPETGILFVSDSGSGQVVRVENGVAKPVITDFPLTPLPLDDSVQVGPLGLLFIDRNTLLVGSSHPAGNGAIVRVFKLMDSQEPVPADAALQTLSFSQEGVESTAPAFVYSLAANLDTIYVSLIAGDTQGAILRTGRVENSPPTLESFLAASESLQAAHPSGLTISPHGYLVVGTFGEFDESDDGLLAFVDTVSRKVLMRIETGLHDISAVAYSQRKQMYALDLAIAKPEDGGLFRIVADGDSPTGVALKKVAALTYPSAMAFDSEGSLYVTVSASTDASGAPSGSLLKIPSDEKL